jgi:type I restriction enzyme M protein
MTDAVGKLWGFCNTLRHDGINYGDYIEQLTYLLFLKLADEKRVPVPEGCSWNDLKSTSGTELADNYVDILRKLGKEPGLLGGIFAGAQSRFRTPVNLKKLISMIDETYWGALDVDLKADCYEGLLQKYAAEQKGAGQYFTPREAIRAVVRCMKPDFREKGDFTIHDPAVGTAGFLIGAYEWIMKATNEGAKLNRDESKRLENNVFSGKEIVQETRRLSLMNLYLHGIESNIMYGDSIAESPGSARYDVILTNPPFGTKGAGETPNRDDFNIVTSNKQLNFIQHVISILKPGGRAAMVLPDNVLFEEHAGKEIRKILLKDCDLHTIIRLPVGTFAPYSAGVKANIVFFRKGVETKEVWIYDLRTNVEKVNKGHALTEEYFADFEKCYGGDPNGHPKPARKETDRFKRFTIKHIAEERGYNLDIFWLKDENLDDPDNLPEPLDLVSEATTHLESAMEAMNELARKLSNGNGENE